MGRSQRLRVSDVRRVYQLVGECCEHWAEPSAWRRHMLRGVIDLTGSMTAMLQRFQVTPQPVAPVLEETASAGWPDQSSYRAYKRIGEDNPPMPGFDKVIGAMMRAGQVSFARQHVASDDVWYRSTFFQQYMRCADSDHFVVSMWALQAEALVFHGISVGRHIDDPRYSRRDVRVLDLVRRDIAPLIGTRLATESHRSVENLPRRCRSTLKMLLNGASEKEIARDLHRSMHTIHEHVKRIHEHFDVSSRSELLAYFIQRAPKPNEPNGQLPSGASPDGDAGR